MLGLGLDMPKPGPILSDQWRMFANLFIVTRPERQQERAMAMVALWEEVSQSVSCLEEGRGQDGGGKVEQSADADA